MLQFVVYRMQERIGALSEVAFVVSENSRVQSKAIPDSPSSRRSSRELGSYDSGKTKSMS